jgi:hypothetical protein
MRNAARCLALVATLLPAALDAQRSASGARLRLFEGLADSAIRVLAAYDDSVRGMNSRLDTVEVGPLRLLTEPSVATLASQAAQTAVDSLRPALGRELERARRYTIVLRVERFNRWRTNRPDSAIVVETFDRTGPALMNIRVHHDPQVVSNSIRMYIPFYVFRDASMSFVGWMGGNVSVDSLNSEDWRLIRFGLISSPAAVSRRCYSGDLAACAVTLGFTPVDDPIYEWYDANDRRRLVTRAERTALRVDGLGTRRCQEGDDVACASVLRGFPPGMLPDPATAQSRATLARLALSVGGSGAVERMLEGDRPPLERLSRAARIPVDSLLRIWQRSARDVRGASRDLPTEIVFGALFWSLALGALSLRSSRWR